MTDRMDKLPKWARDEINLLRRRIQETKDELNALRTKEYGGSGAVILQQYGSISDMKDTCLPDNARIRFTLSDRQNDWLEVKLRDGVLSVMGGMWISILPSSSNTVDLKVRDD